MIKSLGNIIFKAVQRAKPILTNGKSLVNAKEKFSLKNPYILESFLYSFLPPKHNI